MANTHSVITVCPCCGGLRTDSPHSALNHDMGRCLAAQLHHGDPVTEFGSDRVAIFERSPTPEECALGAVAYVRYDDDSPVRCVMDFSGFHRPGPLQPSIICSTISASSISAGSIVFHGNNTTIPNEITVVGQGGAGSTIYAGSAPANPPYGAAWFDAQSNLFKMWNGSAWVPMSHLDGVFGSGFSGSYALVAPRAEPPSPTPVPERAAGPRRFDFDD